MRLRQPTLVAQARLAVWLEEKPHQLKPAISATEVGGASTFVKWGEGCLCVCDGGCDGVPACVCAFQC
jgi:hypothetical protein